MFEGASLLRNILITMLVLLLLASQLGAGAVQAADIAIVVNRKNAVEAISFRDLVKIFRLERQHWEDGTRIYLVMQEAGRPEKSIVLKKIYEMKRDEELKAFWLAKIFREEISSFPQTVSSNEAVKRFVSQVPNAIGFIDASFADHTVKVLRIDGGLPDEQGYVLSSDF